jgi:hypothetical protein
MVRTSSASYLVTNLDQIIVLVDGRASISGVREALGMFREYL